MEQERIEVIVVEPNKPPRIEKIGNDLKSLQEVVGGNIQSLYPFQEAVALVCDDEGKMKDKPLNRALYNEQGSIYDVIAGTFLVVGLGEENFVSLRKDLQDRFMDRFRTPEAFFMMNNKIVVFPAKASVLQQLQQEILAHKAATPRTPRKKEQER